VRLLLTVLRESGVARPIGAVGAQIGADPVAEIEREFARHLDEERGLHASTRGNYISVVRRLLSGRFRRGSVDLGQLRPDDVSRFVVQHARKSPRRMKVIVPALRVFLRWLHQRGDTDTSLSGCVPAVADWRLATVPKSLPSEQVECLLERCDRTTALGRRDYAILVLLARLGLRAGEVVAMELDDLDWQSGELVVRGKGGRQDRLPLSRDVGAAVAAYLRHGRPNCSTRRVFVRARAPRRGFVDSVAISDIVNRALKRAELEPPRKGAHTLRHALACTMLRRGASLAEIGQILRHRSPDTTAIYAKVDLAALRALAPTWPQSAGVA
jgi:site-specific recombinase XerD